MASIDQFYGWFAIAMSRMTYRTSSIVKCANWLGPRVLLFRPSFILEEWSASAFNLAPLSGLHPISISLLCAFLHYAGGCLQHCEGFPTVELQSFSGSFYD